MRHFNILNKEDPMNRGPSLPRRSVLKAGAGFAALAAARVTVGDIHAAERETVRRFEQLRPVDPKRRIILKGGTIISMDAKVGDLAKGDVLIQGDKIAAVGANLAAEGAQVIAASDMILIPGFVDCHRHS